MTTDHSPSLRTFLRSVAALAILAALAGLPPAGRCQGTYSRQDRLEPGTMMRGPFERVASLNDLWYLQSSEKAKGAGGDAWSPIAAKIGRRTATVWPSSILPI